MPANVQELRRRIKATKSIKQITKAMEMIAASKMRRAQQSALQSRPYADLAWEMVSSIINREGEEYTHVLLRKPDKVEVVLTILIAPNRGLCGSLPAQVIAKGLKNVESGQKYITIGRKAERALLQASGSILARFDGFEGQPTPAETRSIASIALKAFINGEVDAVDVVYADFISTLEYQIKRIRIMPIGARDSDLGSVHDSVRGETKVDEDIEFLFEPSPQAVLDELLPRLIELEVYQVVAEALASEHSSRMVTMQNASKAADDLIDDFTLTYNSARQAAITSELADITGGRLAVAR